MNDYKFGNFICQLRTEKGLSQSQLGNMLGVSNKAVSKWEMGVSKPRPSMLLTLATLFGVTVEELLAGERNAESKKECCEKNKDSTIKLWAGEYLKKKKRGNCAVIIAILLPIVLFVWVGVLDSFNLTNENFAPVGAMVIFFAEAIDIALIFVFYGSARRLKRILYAAYHERVEEITAIILPKREKIPMLKWEKICGIISGTSMIIFSALRLIVLFVVKKDNMQFIFNIVDIILFGLGCILGMIVWIHYYMRARKINKRK